MGKTIAAMQRVQQIKERREATFFANRRKDAKVLQKNEARVEIEKHIEVLAPAVATRETVLRNVVDSARQRIAARKRNTQEKVALTTASTARNPPVSATRMEE